MKRYVITCFVMLFAWTFAPQGAISQTSSGPEQDCFGALPINRTLITQQFSYRGAGSNTGEISTGFGCATTAKTNSSWYRLNVASDGFLSFRLTPTATDDYNFAVLRFSASATSQIAGCISATSSPSNLAACNFAPGNGITGLDNALAAQFNSFSQSLAVKRGEVYMIYVSNSTGNGGFTLDFGNSSPGVIPTTPTFPVANVSFRANQLASCGASSSIVATFSEPILRGSVQPGTFQITGPNNQVFSVVSVACANCPSTPGSDDNTRQGVSYTLTFSPTISQSGTYTIALSSTAGAVTLRNVDNSPISMPATPLIINVGTNLPGITSSRPLTNNATSFCLGQNVTISTEDAGTGTQYQWLREGNNGTLLPVTNGTGRSLTITGGYAQRVSSTDSSSVIIVTQTGVFRIRVTDGNGCVRTSNPINVTVSPGLQATILNAPGAGIDLTPCRNEGVYLVAQEGFRSYLWHKNFQPIDTAKSRIFFALEDAIYSVETVDNNGCANMSRDLTLSSRDVSPVIVRGDTVNCADETGKVTNPITLSVIPSMDFQTYQWYTGSSARNGTRSLIVGATQATLSVTAGTFHLVVKMANGCTSTSANFTVKVGIAPRRPIVSEVALGIMQAICPGGTFPLFGPAGFPRYQWYFKNAPIMGAVSRRYDATEPGEYAVQVFSEDGCPSPISMPPVVISQGVVLPGIITSSSGSLTTCRGTPLDISVSIPDTLISKATIEWTRVGATAIIGTARTLRVTDAGQYRVAVQFVNGNPCPVSAIVTVGVVDNPDPKPTTPTGGNTFCQGGSLTLDAGAFASYQWFTVAGGVSTAIPGATMRTLVVRAAGSYSVRVTADGGCVGTSAPFAVTELPAPTTPVIRSRNGSLELCPNGSLELFVENADPALTYQWFLNNTAIAGATRTALTVLVIGSYTVEARSSNGCTSRPNSPSEVTLATLPTAPVLPSAITICPNADTTVTAPAGFMAYQWLSGIGGAAQPIVGETNRQFRINRAGSFSVRVTNMIGCINTSSTITVSQTQVVVRIDTIDAGVRFRGSSTPRARLYQWLLNGMNIPGANDSLFAPQVNGSYSVRVTDINGCVQTSSAQRFEIIPPIVRGCTTNCGPSTPTGAPPTIRGDSVFAAPGDTVIFSIRLPALGTLRPGARIDATICFNATLLEPLAPLPAGTITGGVRCITLPLTIPTDTTQPLFNLPFRAALGNDSVTALVINSRLSPGGAPLPATASYFRLTTISYAGGARLIGPPPRMRLTPSRPNPVSDDATISYVIENASSDRAAENVNVSVSDVFGRVIKTLPITQLIGKTGDIPLNTADLSPGVYFVTVRSERGAVQVQKIHVVR